ncbi:hypothetical protein Bca52824_022431 [Brassica carinata]|uniref:Uncharacterized protein n=1 Tax=Brassica carinata TaxID=52824 RepID=A0A8X7VGC1_BRACI|nr:hypothetical protein Bca52824_022431 [Brassica carinata]
MSLRAIFLAIWRFSFSDRVLSITALFQAVFVSPRHDLRRLSFDDSGFSMSVVELVFHYDVRVKFCYKIIWDKKLVVTFFKTNSQLLFLLRFDCTLTTMADNLRRAIQDLTLGIDDEPVALPVEVCNEAVRATQFSLMCRPLMQRKQNLRAMVSTLPRIWGLSGIINGRIVERSKVQFVFPSEELIWHPGMNDLMLNSIPFWVQIRGIPLQFLTEPVIRHIGDTMGEVIKVDFAQEANVAVEFVRFSQGVNTVLRFKYERLWGFCETCGSLIHDTRECIPNDPMNQDTNDDEDDFQEEGHAEEDQDGDMMQEEVQNQPEIQDVAGDENQHTREANVGNSSFTQLMVNVWNEANGDAVRDGFVSSMEVERTGRKRKFIDDLLDSCSEGPEKLGFTSGRAMVESDEESDHVSLAMEDSWNSGRLDNQYGSFMRSGESSAQSKENQNVEESGNLQKKQRYEELLVDKRVVIQEGQNAVVNALSKIIEDYGEAGEQTDWSLSIDRDAVGPVPPQSSDYVRDIGVYLGFDQMQIVPPVGLSGGLVVYWKQFVSVSCISFDSRIVDMQVEYKSFSFYLSCVYGHPIPKYRHLLWERLQRLAVSRHGPWMMCGDFNEITRQSEKKGGRSRSVSSFQDFKTMIAACNMHDLPSKGNPFSWVGKRRTEVIECCLDRAMVNDQWSQKYPASETEFLEIAESDHRPLIISIEYTKKKRRGWFRYDKRLFRDQGLTQNLEGWNSKLSQCRGTMVNWKKQNQTNAAVRIKDIRASIDQSVRDPCITLNRFISYEKNLIHQSSRQWDQDKLEENFNQQEQGLIKSLKFSRFNIEDKYIWPFNRNGQYSVKSGYWVATHLSLDGEPIIPPEGSVVLKQKVWKLQILPKIKQFLWRAISGALPTAVRLCTRGIFIDPTCQRCCLEEETINHMLFVCPHALAIWRCANNPLANSFKDNLEDNLAMMFDQIVSVEVQMSLSSFWIIWYIWKSRNEFLFSKRNVHPVEDARRAIDANLEWHANCAGTNDDTVWRGNLCDSFWEPPPNGWVKCNFDSSYRQDREFTGLGWIVRDYKGAHLASGMAKIRDVSSSLEAEASAFLYVLQQMWSLGWRNIWFEGDCSQLTFIGSCQSGTKPSCGYSIKEKLGCFFFFLCF